VPLQGECKIVPLRQAPLLGHNAISLEFLLPPKGVGLSVELDFHSLRKRLFTKVQLAPQPKVSCRLKRIDLSQIQKESVVKREL
jgi:hypothetical protein